MDAGAEELLSEFAAAANKGHLHEEDWKRFYIFTLHIFRNHLSVIGSEVTTHLFGHGFSSEQAAKLSAEFERYLQLLKLYDDSLEMGRRLNL